MEKYIYGETFSMEAPRPTAVAYEILTSHLSGESKNKEDSHEALNDIFKVLADSEREADIVLEKLERQGSISREDTLMLIVLLAVSKTLGPDLGFLRKAIITGSFNFNELNNKLAQSGLNKTIIDYLQVITTKLNL